LIFTHAALEPAPNTSYGPLPGKVGHISYTVILSHLVDGVCLKGLYQATLKKLLLMTY
jgi:hypothetical protein